MTTNGPFPSSYPPAHPPTPLAAGPRRGGRVVGTALLVGALAGAVTGAGGAAVLQDHHAQTVAQAAVSDKSPALDTQPAAAPTTNGSTESAAAAALPSVVKIYASGAQQGGSGSGIILTANGEILTNNHVVELAADGGKLAVSFDDGSTAPATILGRDPLTDLAVIKADGVNGRTPAAFGDSDTLAVGQQVIALGAPYGLESTVTTGIVSALNRPVTTQGEAAGDPATVFPAIQTDAAINPGNSGGPLINISGQVIGIDSAIKTTSSSNGSQSGSIGLGFAIPISDALPIVEQLRKGETPTHARIGVTVGDATDEVGLPDGALVGEVSSGSAADQAGLEHGQVITKVDDFTIDNGDSLVATVRSYRPGDTVRLAVTSSTANGTSTGPVKTVTLTLGSDAN